MKPLTERKELVRWRHLKQGSPNMPALKTIARAEGDHVTVRIPEEYRPYFLEIVISPVRREDAGMDDASLPAWAGLCEGSITKNADGPHDMESVRESIRSADRVSA